MRTHSGVSPSRIGWLKLLRCGSFLKLSLIIPYNAGPRIDPFRPGHVPFGANLICFAGYLMCRIIGPGAV